MPRLLLTVRGPDHPGVTAALFGHLHRYGAVLGGTAGTVHVLRSLLAETDLTMALNGYASLAELTPDILTRVG